MLSASLYITVCTTRNRLRVRLRRLREPRYLLGAIVGTAYLYFSVLGPRRGRRPGRPGNNSGPAIALLSAWQVAGVSLAGLGAFVMALLAWLLPTRSGLLEFSPAEIAFLFSAPVSRRQLLVHRIVRSQISSLFLAAVMAIVIAPSSGFARFRFAVGMWALFTTFRIYFAAVTLMRARFSASDASVRRAAWVPIAVLLAALATVAGAIVRQLISAPATGALDFAVRIARATSTGLPSLILWPFNALVDPLLESTVGAFAVSMGGSLAVLGAVTTIMLLSDATFDLAARETGEPGQRSRERQSTAPPRALNPGWTLELTGRPEWAFVWKGVMQTIRAFNVRALRLVAPAIFGLIAMSAAAMAASRLQGPAAFISVVAAINAGAAVLFGPQWMRQDLRGDFQHLDLLKTWPVRAADLIRGEMAWPAIFISGCAWLGILCAGLFSGTALPDVPFVDRWAIALAAAIAAPALVAAQFTIHNAIALIFPAWVPSGARRTRGIDAMGQQLIMLAAIVIALLIFALPGAIAGVVAWFVFHRLIGSAVFVLAATLFAGIVAVEVLAATELLGPAYERLDLLSVERGE
jgi:ABC-2 type transport system permease protein